MEVALVENANTNNITIISSGNYRFTLPDGSQVSPVEAGWVGDKYRVCSINPDLPKPTYVNIIDIASNGINYTTNNMLTLVGGVGNAAQIQVFGTGTNGIVTSVIIANTGYYMGGNPSSPNSPTGGTGSGVILTVSMMNPTVTSKAYIYNANTNTVTEKNTYAAPTIDNTESVERQRQRTIRNDSGNINLKDKLKTATSAQIDTWLQNNVTNLAEARAVLGSIIKFLAERLPGETGV